LPGGGAPFFAYYISLFSLNAPHGILASRFARRKSAAKGGKSRFLADQTDPLDHSAHHRLPSFSGIDAVTRKWRRPMKKLFATTATALTLTAPAWAATVEQLDANKDGLVTLEEVQIHYPGTTEANFAAMDKDEDGSLSAEELGDTS